ncbi:MAG: tetratricopeptide repeat protein [Candidatus Schekmanbacteria bacterium]|nr:tetratricopeptide repeat protein [Candidatus Schekmanbacteria bacterium]
MPLAPSCPRCQESLPDKARYCPGCGHAVALRCPRCRASVIASARHCAECGAAVDAAAPPSSPTATSPPRGELCTATILFAELVGYAAMAEHLDPEDVHDVMKRLFRVTDRAVLANGGSIDKHLAGGVMAVFGLPRAGEDDAARAIRAALQFQKEIEFLNRQLADEGVPAAKLRVGINTGRVVAASVDGPQKETSILGDAVNIASRLQSACPPGAILVSHETYRHVRGLFGTLTQPPIFLRGRSHPITTYLIQEEKHPQLFIGTREVLGQETEMVGRTDEMSRLWLVLDDLIQRRRAASVTIVGPPGVGKSRLVHEFHRRADAIDAEMLLLRARASAETADLPYQALAQSLLGRAGIRDQDSGDAARRKLERWLDDILSRAITPRRRATDVSAAPPAADSPASWAESRDRICELLGVHRQRDAPPKPGDREPPGSLEQSRAALVELFRQLCRQPVILEVEDAQWADVSTMGMLDHLVEHLVDYPLLVLTTARPEIAAAHPDWVRRAERAVLLTLAPLDLEAARELVEQLLQNVRDLPSGLVEEVAQRCEGTPFFAEELVKSLADQGAIVAEELGWRFVPSESTPQLPMPATVEGLLQARLDRLAPGELAAIRAAAVVGRVFWKQAVAHVWSYLGAAEDVNNALRGLLEREMIDERPVSSLLGCEEFAFTHDLLRDVSYRGLPPGDRRELHRLVAEWLERHCGDRLRERLPLLAYHWEQAGTYDRACALYLSGANDAVTRYAHAEARRLFRSYLNLAPADAITTAQVRTQLALDVLHMCGRNDEARQELLRALDTACAAGDRRTEAMARHGLGVVASVLGNMSEALSSCQAAVDIYAELRADSQRGEALAELAHALSRVGKVPEAVATFEEALRIQRAAGRPGPEAQALTGLAALHAVEGRYREAGALYEKAIAIFRDLGDRKMEGRALGNLALCRAESTGAESTGAETARESMEHALAIYRDIGDRRFEGWMLSNLAAEAHQAGEPDRALALFEAALRIHRSVGNRAFEAETLCALADLKADIGRYDDARELLEAAENINRETKNLLFVATGMVQRAKLERQCRRDLVAAEALLREAEPIYRKLETWHYLVICLLERGRIACERGLDGRPYLEEAQRLIATGSTEGSRSLLKEVNALVAMTNQDAGLQAGDMFGRRLDPAQTTAETPAFKSGIRGDSAPKGGVSDRLTNG